jgi:membrane protein DedA with SNARE-associated domain
MSPLQFYVANILSALVWAPAHVFPGVLLATALRLSGVSAEQPTVVIIAGLIVVLAVVGAIRLASARS